MTCLPADRFCRILARIIRRASRPRRPALWRGQLWRNLGKCTGIPHVFAGKVREKRVGIMTLNRFVLTTAFIAAATFASTASPQERDAKKREAVRSAQGSGGQVDSPKTQTRGEARGNNGGEAGQAEAHRPADAPRQAEANRNNNAREAQRQADANRNNNAREAQRQADANRNNNAREAQRQADANRNNNARELQ